MLEQNSLHPKYVLVKVKRHIGFTYNFSPLNEYQGWEKKRNYFKDSRIKIWSIYVWHTKSESTKVLSFHWVPKPEIYDIYYVAQQRIPLLVKWCMVVAMMDAVVFVWPKLDCLSDTSQILILHWSPPCALSPSVCQCENHRMGKEPIPHLQVTSPPPSVGHWTSQTKPGYRLNEQKYDAIT